MNDEVRKYEIISKTACNFMIIRVLIIMLISGILFFLNKWFAINKVWNICFLSPIYILYFSTVILDNLVNFRIGRYDIELVNSKVNKMSNLVLASNIVFFVTIFIVFMYILMSLILFS